MDTVLHNFLNFKLAQTYDTLLTSICLYIDLTGQVNADSIGTRMYSGFGGQVDFIRGAAEGFDGKGKPIIAIPSVTKRNESKIVPTLKTGRLKNVFTSRPTEIN